MPEPTPEIIDIATTAVLAQSYDYSTKHLRRLRTENSRVWRETRKQVSIALHAAHQAVLQGTAPNPQS